MLKTHSTYLSYNNQKYPSKGPMNSVQSDGIGGYRLTSSFCNYKMLTIFFHRIHYIWSSCSCTWIKTWTKSALSKESHKYTTKKQTVAAMMLATQNPQKNSAMYIPVWGYSFFLELGSGGYGQGYICSGNEEGLAQGRSQVCDLNSQNCLIWGSYLA